MTHQRSGPAVPRDAGPHILGRRSRRSLATRLGAGTSLAVLVGLLVPMAPAEASLADVGPVAANGFPRYLEDSSGLRLRLCDDPADGCTMAAVPNPDEPVSFPANYAGENFYFAATTADASYEAALEAAFTTADATPGEQIMFSRIRIRLTGLVAGKTYHITHPYGVLDLVAAPDKKNPALGIINYTDDQGCLAPSCGDFRSTLGGFVGDSSATSMNFLTRVGFDPATATAGAEIGDPLTPTAVTGSPFGTNAVTVEGPNAGGPGVDVSTQSSFTIEGQAYGSADPSRPSTPDLAAASDTGRSDADNITNLRTPTFEGTAVPGSQVDLLVNGQQAGGGTAADDGTYAITPAGPLASGSPRLQARSANPAYLPSRDPANAAYVPESDPGNPAYDAVAFPEPPVYDVTTPATLTSGTLNMKVDTTAPPATIGTPRPTNGTIDPTPTFLFSSAEAGSTFECRLSRGADVVVDFEPCTSGLTYDDQVSGSYTFAVRATDPAGNVGATAAHTWSIGSLPTAPGTPGTPTPVAGNGSAVVSWSAPTGGGAPLSYTVRAFANNAAAASATVPDLAATATSVTVPGLVNGTAYTFDVTAVNASGSTTSARSVIATPVAPVVPVAAPTVSLASGTYAGTQSVTMTAPGAPAGTTIRYTVGVGTAVPPDPTATTGTRYTVPVSVPTSRVVKVAAFNAAGVRGPVVQRSYTIAAVPATPAAPTATAGVAGGAITATARWVAPATGGSPITGYVVRALRMSAAGAVLSTTTSTLQPTTARQLQMTLPVAGSYRFTVQARNVIGNSAQSARSAAVAGR